MLQLVEASGGDIDVLSEMEHRLFDYDIISYRQMRYLLHSATASVIMAEVQARAVGYMILLRRKNSAGVRIYSIGVLEEARQHGIGKKLLQFAETDSVRRGCDRLQMEVRMTNSSAIVFYLSSGFSLHGRKNDYYTDGSSALCLRKYLSKGSVT